MYILMGAAVLGGCGSEGKHTEGQYRGAGEDTG